MHRIHYILGYSGLIPFIGLACLAIYGWQQATFLLLSYAALILSFLGGVVWMATIQNRYHWGLAVASNIAMLLAWLAVIFHDETWALVAVAATMLLLLWLESIFLKKAYSVPFFQLRKRLTLGATISLLSAAFVA